MSQFFSDYVNNICKISINVAGDNSFRIMVYLYKIVRKYYRCTKEGDAMKQKSIVMLILGALIFTLTGCGRTEADNPTTDTQAESPVTVDGATTATTEEPTSEPAPLTLEDMIAEQELRLDQGLFVEEDYLALAELYRQAGNQEAGRAIIYRALRLYPSEKYIDILSDMTKIVTMPEEDIREMLTELEGYWVSQDISSVRTLINSEKWKSLFGGELDVITGRTLLLDTEVRYQVASDALETVVTAFYADGKVKYFITNADGSKYLDATLKDNTYEGDFTYAFWDGTDELQSRYCGTLQDGHCVDELTIYYDGATYVGEFAEDGTTKEKQIDKTSKKNQVIYAYNSKKTKYLYVADAKVSEWMLTVDKFALPIVEEWQQ